MKKKVIITSLILILFLSACTPSGGAETDLSDALSEGVSDSTASTNDKIRLSDDYNDALTVESQLALGTIRLEDTDLAVDETLAAEILPLWQALQSLTNSETAASMEVTAVLNQIQDTMAPEQIQAIAEMSLTNEALTEMFNSGELSMGRTRPQGEDGETTGGGQRGGGGILGQGGGPGGGPGGGGLPGGGNISEDDIATRRAEFESGDGMAQFQDQALVMSVIRTLQTKTGEAPTQRPGGLFTTALEAVSAEIGVSVEGMQTKMQEGQTLRQIIEEAGGDVEALRTVMVEALGDVDNDNMSAEEIVNNWLQQ